MVTKEEIIEVIPELHDEDIQSAYDFIRFLIQKRNTALRTVDRSAIISNPVSPREPNGIFTWDDVASEVCQKVSKPSFETWFNRTSGEKVSSTSYLVRSETEFQKEWLESKYSTLISEAIAKINGSPLNLEFSVDRDYLTKGVG